MHISRTMSLPNFSTANDIAKPSELNRSQSLSELSETDIDHIESSLTKAVQPNAVMIPAREAARLFEGATKYLDKHNSDMMSEMSEDGRDVVIAIEQIAIQETSYRNEQSNSCTPAQELTQRATAFLRDVQDRQGSSLNPRERTIALMDFLGRIINNDFKGDLGRWAANGANIGVRTGVIVGLTTLLRQLIGFSFEKALFLGDASMPAREVIGTGAMLLGPALNIAGFVRDEVNHTATPSSRTARVAMSMLSASALLVASQTGEPSTLGSLMSSVGMQTASYTLSRDLAQLFFPLSDNAPINLRGAFIAGSVYSGIQFSVGEAMDALAPSSGAGRVMAAAAAAAHPSASGGAATERMVEWFTSKAGSMSPNHVLPFNIESISDRVHSAVSALQPDLAQDATRGALNAVAEISDDLIRPSISRALHVSQTKAAARREALAQGHDPEAAVAALPREGIEGLRVRLEARMPNPTQVANQFLTTNAMRTSAFETIMGISMSVSTVLQQTNMSSINQGHVINAVVAAVVAMIYGPFLYAHEQRMPTAQPEASLASSPSGDVPQEMELRRRHIP